jgi:prohibitin 1
MVLGIFAYSCAIVRPGEVGVKRTMGKLKPGILQTGPHPFNPFVSKVITLPIKLSNMDIQEALPSQEGIMVTADISILYRIDPEFVPYILGNIGYVDFENVVIRSVFKSAAPNITSKYLAKDLYTVSRSEIQADILIHMQEVLSSKGFIIENVLLKNISLPGKLQQSIEAKLQAEQDAQRMEFVLQKEKKEAERKVIEAQGIKNSQEIISQSLNPEIIEWKSLEVFQNLSQSPNTKVIITNGNTPMLIQGSEH